MPAPINYTSALLALFLLTFLSILTVEVCRRNRLFFAKDDRKYLFQARSALESLAGNLGSTFSVTYFFGAMVLYSQALNYWALLPIPVGFGIALGLQRRLLADAKGVVYDPISYPHNIVLELVRNRTEGDDRHLASFYAFSYFLLLVVELAVTRVVLASLFPARPIVAGILLALISLIVSLYLFIGGFQAVLVSDLVQIVVLAAFMLCLLFILLSASTSSPEASSVTDDSSWPSLILSLVGFGLIALSWSLVGLDFSSRMNFLRSTRRERKAQRSGGTVLRPATTAEQLNMIRASYALIIAVVLVGNLFGNGIQAHVAIDQGPLSYVQDLAALFVDTSPLAVQMLFLVSLFCMTFSTLDSLLLATLQAGHYTRQPFLRRTNLLRIVLVAAVLSIVVSQEYLYTLAMLAASLVILPLFPVLRVMYGTTRLIPPGTRYIWASAGISCIGCWRLNDLFLADLWSLFSIPSAITLTTLLCMFAERGVRALIGVSA